MDLLIRQTIGISQIVDVALHITGLDKALGGGSGDFQGIIVLGVGGSLVNRIGRGDCGGQSVDGLRQAGDLHGNFDFQHG